MRILTSNLESALTVAVRTKEKEDGFESTFVAGLKEVLDAIKNGEPITVEDE